MTDSPSQHALREVRRIYTMRLAQMILLAVVVLLGISGPFGTLESMSFGPRLAYWLITVPLTFAIGVYVSSWMLEVLRVLPQRWLARALAAFATSVAIGIAVAFINWIAFGQSPAELGYIGPLLISVMATAAVIALVLQFMSEQQPETTETTAAPPALLERLDYAKRGALISLSVQDHYVEVTTDKGQSLVLMRLSDAIKETSPVEGVQIHRSHWVALKHITAARREGDKAVLTLSDGRELPASRSNIKALKDLGILPK